MRRSILSVFVGMVLVISAFSSYAGEIAPELQLTLEILGPDEEISVIATLSDKVDLELFKNQDKGFRRSKLIRALKDKAGSTQGPLIAFLRSRRVAHISPLWIINGMAVTARADVVLELANQPGVESIRLDGTLGKPEPAPATSAPPEWNLGLVRAPELWNLGFTGVGIVVSSMDTGVDVNHPDLSDKWRGGTNSWFDPNGEHNTPYDADGHGTQTMGIIVGGSAGGTAIGVAPGANWIAVKIFNDAGLASFSGIHQGFQWLLDPDGNPDTNDSPDVVNNSWGLRNNVGECVPEFQGDIQALKAAEIAVVFSAGNEGPNPSTSLSPANYPESFAIGSINDAYTVASSSSRGPSSCDGTVYPEVVAPGVNVRTSDLTFGGIFPNSYAYVSGTSFAAPHVAGAMSLLLGAYPGLTVSKLESVLQQSALDLGIAGADNDYGYGLIDAMEAYTYLVASPQCTDADGDGYYAEPACGALVDCNDGDPAIYPGAPEIKHDGIDQDCNGYDLTIDILKALYTEKKDTLSVEAASELGRNANLVLVEYGPMSWSRKTSRWSLSLSSVGVNPGMVIVSGIEGSESAATTSK